MNPNKKNLIKEASNLLDKMENGKTYPIGYVIQNFEKAASLNSQDVLICQMRDVIVKMANRKEYISQKEIGELYDKMYGFSGNQSAFRGILNDFLPDSKQLKKVSHQASKLRTQEELNLETIHKDSELSNAFSVLFSLGGDSSFGTFKPGQNKNIEKAVIGKLSNLGRSPIGVDIIQANDHFTLCAANYESPSLQKISVLIPVQTTDGIAKEPKNLILGNEVVELNSRNLFTSIKEQERNQKEKSNKKFANQRGSGQKQLEMKEIAVPESLSDFANLENTLVAVASKFEPIQINMAIEMINAELLSFGAKNPCIKIAGADSKNLMFDVHLNTPLGKSVIHVPVEVHQKKPILPSRFATNATLKEQNIYDFSKKGYQKFISNLNSNSHSLKIARDTGPLSMMNYNQLMDQIIEGVSSQDYKLAEDALQTIEAKYESDKYKKSFEYYTQLLKHSSNSSKRKELIKAAFERGELIRIPTSVDLYCPKLGLSVNKISFDENGNIIPAGRRNKADNQIQDTSISTSRILFT